MIVDSRLGYKTYRQDDIDLRVFELVNSKGEMVIKTWFDDQGSTEANDDKAAELFDKYKEAIMEASGTKVGICGRCGQERHLEPDNICTGCKNDPNWSNM